MEIIKQKFNELFKCSPQDVQFIPYRICPIGAHIDHQQGKVTGFAIDKGVYMAYSKTNDRIVKVFSLQFPEIIEIDLGNMPSVKLNDWADHVRGAIYCLSKRYELKYGINVGINGQLPIGGLSSSASVIIGVLVVLARVNDIKLFEREIIEMAKEAENSYVGVNCGSLDQSCEVYGKSEHMLYLDAKTGEYKLIKRNENVKPFEILLIFSGTERSLTHSKYNTHKIECQQGAKILSELSRGSCENESEICLRDIPCEVFEKFGMLLPDNLYKRAKHFYSEMDRVERGVIAWQRGDIEQFGKLCFESGKSSIKFYETGSKELITVYEILKRTKGVYGGRFSGAGFNGWSIAFVNPKFSHEIIEKITREYCEIYPELREKFMICDCKISDGVRI